jgi:hypothetical protein
LEFDLEHLSCLLKNRYELNVCSGVTRVVSPMSKLRPLMLKGRRQSGNREKSLTGQKPISMYGFVKLRASQFTRHGRRLDRSVRRAGIVVASCHLPIERTAARLAVPPVTEIGEGPVVSASTRLPRPKLGKRLPALFGLDEKHHFNAACHLRLVLRDLAYGDGNGDISEYTYFVRASLKECNLVAASPFIRSTNSSGFCDFAGRAAG